MDAQSSFEGWAVIELFGHQREVGHISTVYYGDKAMFHVDVPELPERQTTLKSPRYMEGKYYPEGTVISLARIEGRTRLISPGAVYAINPCTEELARKELDEVPRSILSASMPPAALLPGESHDGDLIEEENFDLTNNF